LLCVAITEFVGLYSINVIHEVVREIESFLRNFTEANKEVSVKPFGYQII